MILLNFSHPLTAEHRVQIETLAGQSVTRVIDVPVQIDHAQPLSDQVTAIADRAGLPPTEWQNLPLLVNPPGYAPAAAALLAELHGRMGHFPALLWVQPVPDSTPTRYQVSAVVNLQDLREAARQRRANESPD